MSITTSAVNANVVVFSELSVNGAVVTQNTFGGITTNTSAIFIGNTVLSTSSVSTYGVQMQSGPLFVGGTSIFGGIVNTQFFTSSGTWTNPLSNAALGLTGAEQVFIMAWGAGSTWSQSQNGCGGACVFGTFTTANLPSTVTVTIGAGGTYTTGSTPENGGNTYFGTYLTSYGSGTELNQGSAPIGGGWLDNSAGPSYNSYTGNSAFGGMYNVGSTVFGGAGPNNSSTYFGGGSYVSSGYGQGAQYALNGVGGLLRVWVIK